MRNAVHADALLEIMAAYAQQGSNLCLAALAGAQRFEEWRHYPFNDATDAVHHTEFYYHAHAARERAPNEHGHFHVFARPAGRAAFHHLIGISLNPQGWPTRLFLTNQWVTAEHWISARQMEPHLTKFECQVAGRLAPVARWITHMVRLYESEIRSLHLARDAWLAQRINITAQRSAVFENRRFQVIAEQPISLDRLLRATLAAA